MYLAMQCIKLKNNSYITFRKELSNFVHAVFPVLLLFLCIIAIVLDTIILGILLSRRRK